MRSTCRRRDTGIQVKVGGRELDEDIAAIRAVARALRPGVTLAVDANRSWSVQDAMHASAACRDVRVALEQPCASYEEIAVLRGRLAHPVILDEIVESPEVAMRAIVEGVADGFGLKVSRVGGVGPMLAIRDMCRARRVSHTCDDAWGGDITAATCVHIAATVDPSVLAGVWIAAPYIPEHLDPAHPVVAEAGRIAVPSGPGLGIEPDVRSWPDPVALYEA